MSGRRLLLLAVVVAAVASVTTVLAGVGLLYYLGGDGAGAAAPSAQPGYRAPAYRAPIYDAPAYSQPLNPGADWRQQRQQEDLERRLRQVEEETCQAARREADRQVGTDRAFARLGVAQACSP